jgi:hypothetical protein
MHTITEASPNELTLQLNGYPDVDKFASFINNSRHLIKALAVAVIPHYRRTDNKVHWFPINASINGSVFITYEGRTANPDNFLRVEDAFFRVGEALRSGADIPYTPSVEQYASNLRKVVEKDKSIESLVFMNEGNQTLVKSVPELSNKLPTVTVYDEIQGRIETISSRKGLRFILYDSHFDRAVTCYVNNMESEEQLTKHFGKLVRVMGLVIRDAETDRPFKIKDIQQVTAVETPKLSWRDAEGIIQLPKNQSPESFIRSLRDA